MKSDQTASSGVAYFGHDVNDAAIRRRVAMLAEAGIPVRLGGFRRSVSGAQGACGGRVVDLGQTGDARLLQRTIAVLRHLLSPRAIRALGGDAQVLVARNLEMLALAARVRRGNQRLVYECLDVHRIMLGNGSKSRLIRWIERRLLACTDLVIVSSPAFARDYFQQRQGRGNAVLLVENKVPAAPVVEPVQEAGAVRPEGTCVIGWFGMLRCRRTLDHLARIVRQSAGSVCVIIAGRPSPAEFPDFAAQVAGMAGVTFLGPYQPHDLPGLYARVDYVWAIDYFEEGLNSDWLLPNRLYEGLAHGAVPIALARVETGRWLARHEVGLLIDDPACDLPGRLPLRGDARLTAMRAAVRAIDPAAVFQTGAERRAIMAAILGGGHA
ncbi:glycosyltransferase [Novosphingobium colocasiae]|uniref:glycosyltransferase n=1 Tax=Novosphingobium colocasiae TaxID=1256513 RepID=UPI0035AE1D55